ncbi:MAG: YggT family protein [bacterium]
MFVLGNFLKALATVIDVLLYYYMWIVIVNVVLSWINPNPHNHIVVSIIRFLYQVTEPVLAPIRKILSKWIPSYRIGIDFSPFVLWLIIVFLRVFLVGSLMQVAAVFR